MATAHLDTPFVRERLDPAWAVDAPLPWIGNPYNWRNGPPIFWNKLTGPSPRYRELSSFLPRRHRFCEIEPRLRIAFLGDLLPGRGKRYRVGAGLRAFLDAADYLTVNLEGVVCDRSPVWNAVIHEPWILDFLADLFPPERTIVLCANNHSADCGWGKFNRGYEGLRERGFRVLGRRDEPSLLLPEGVLIANGTEWLNVKGPYVARLADAVESAGEKAEIRLLCPHWGAEMALYPSPPQIEQGRRLLVEWDAIVGHHTHCPQPIAVERGKLAAWSLGNFARGDGGERGWHGAALLATLGPDATGRWRLGESQWTFTAQKPQTVGTLSIDAAETCRFHDV